MNKTLYMIANKGCDDTTYGMVELSQEEHDLAKKIFDTLNENSHRGCQPTINFCRYKELTPTPTEEQREYMDFDYEHEGRYYKTMLDWENDSSNTNEEYDEDGLCF